MKQRLLIFLLVCLFISVDSWSQPVFKKGAKGTPANKEPAKGNQPPKKDPGTTRTTTGGKKNNSNKTVTPSKTGELYEVFIHTDKECRVKIDGKMHTVRVDDGLKLKLKAGKYHLYAESVTTGDTYTDTLKVLASGNNSFPIPMMKVIRARDERTNPDKKGPVGPISPASTEKDTRVAEVATELRASLVPVASGKFRMGSDAGSNDEYPLHPVTIPSLLFSKYEVTQQQWEKVMGNNPSSNKGCARCPVESVSWEEVSAFLEKINRVSPVKFRLPTEAEWEYVASKSNNRQIRKSSWNLENSKAATKPVGTLPPDGAGLHDLFGNVAEWCSDWYSSNYYRNSPTDNPPGPKEGRERVVRGGSFNDYQSTLRSSSREKGLPGNKSSTVGFRLVTDAN